MTEIGIPAALYRGIHSSGEEAWQCINERDDPFYAALGPRCYSSARRAISASPKGSTSSSSTTPETPTSSSTPARGNGTRRVAQYEPVLQAARARDLPMVCANADLVVIHRGRRIICAGALAQRYEELGGRVRWHGKPFASVYEASLAMLGIADRRRVLAVGDSLRTDIAGAARRRDRQRCGSLGGLHAEELGVTPGAPPDAQRIEAALAAAGESPLAVARGFCW